MISSITNTTPSCNKKLLVVTVPVLAAFLRIYSRPILKAFCARRTNCLWWAIYLPQIMSSVYIYFLDIFHVFKVICSRFVVCGKGLTSTGHNLALLFHREKERIIMGGELMKLHAWKDKLKKSVRCRVWIKTCLFGLLG